MRFNTQSEGEYAPTIMPDLQKTLEGFSAQTPDAEIIDALDQFMVSCGINASTSRLPIMETSEEKTRCFVIVFKKPDESYQFAAKHHVSTFAYDSVRIQVPAA